MLHFPSTPTGRASKIDPCVQGPLKQKHVCRGTTLNALVEVADLKALRERLAAGGGASLRRSAPVKAAAELKQDVLDHEIVLTTALNQVRRLRVRRNLLTLLTSSPVASPSD